MNKKILWLLFSFALIVFIAEIVLIAFGLNGWASESTDSNHYINGWVFIWIAIGIAIISLIVGGILLYIADAKYGGSGYLVTSAYGIMVPLFAPLALYFIMREIKGEKHGI